MIRIDCTAIYNNTSKSIDSRSFEPPRNQRTIPLSLPTEFRSELEVESESKALSLCLGVKVGRVGAPFRRKLAL